MLDKVLGKIKETIGIIKFDDTKILIDTDDKLPGYITLENVVILITCIIKHDGKTYRSSTVWQIKSMQSIQVWHPTKSWDLCLSENVFCRNFGNKTW